MAEDREGSLALSGQALAARSPANEPWEITTQSWLLKLISVGTNSTKSTEGVSSACLLYYQENAEETI